MPLSLRQARKRSATLANLARQDPDKKEGKRPKDGGDRKDGGGGGGDGGGYFEGQSSEDVLRADQAHVAADVALFDMAAALANDDDATPTDRALAMRYVRARALSGHTFRGGTYMDHTFVERMNSAQPLTIAMGTYGGARGRTYTSVTGRAITTGLANSQHYVFIDLHPMFVNVVGDFATVAGDHLFNAPPMTSRLYAAFDELRLAAANVVQTIVRYRNARGNDTVLLALSGHATTWVADSNLMDNLSDRRGERPLLIDLPLHPSGLRGQVGVYGQFMSFMRAVRAEIEYLTALRDTQMHDHGLRRWYITELEAADTANH